MRMSNRSVFLKQRAVRIVLVAAIVLLAAAPGWFTNAAAQSSAPQLRFEGYLKAQGPGKWYIGDEHVSVDAQTRVIEKQGRAEVGAWLIVWADTTGAGALRADLIVVDRPAGQDGPIVQITGRLTKINGLGWRIENTVILITSATIIHGDPQIGCRLWVMAEQRGNDLYGLRLDVISCGADDVPRAFEGQIETMPPGLPALWIVSGQPVRVLTDTEIIGTPAVGSDVEILALLDISGVPVARRVRVMAPDSRVSLGAMVANIQPTIDGVQMWDVVVFSAEAWADPIPVQVQVSGSTLVDERRAVARASQWAEIRAEPLADQAYRARQIRLTQPTPVSFTAALTYTSLSAGKAGSWWWVNGRRAWIPRATLTGDRLMAADVVVEGVVLGNGVIWVKAVHPVPGKAGDAIEAGSAPDHDGLPATVSGTPPPPEVTAATGATPWSQPMPIAVGLTSAERPVLVYGADRAAHAVWESNGVLFYASRPANGVWTAAQRVAAGESPALVADSAGQLHLVFANEFSDNYDIFYVQRTNGVWTLPVQMSYTSDYSAEPALTITPNGALHAAWQDYTPGYWTIYSGRWDGEFWSSRPIPNGRGQAPVLAAAPDGAIYTAWQDRLPISASVLGPLEILSSKLVGEQWTLPAEVSDNTPVDAFGVSLATTADSLAHLTWVLGGNEVRYRYGQGIGWSAPYMVSWAMGVANGPHILAESNGLLDIAWDEGGSIKATRAPAGSAKWPPAEEVVMRTAGLRDVTMTAGPSGGVGLGWVQTGNADKVNIYAAWRDLPIRWYLWLPVLSVQ